MITDGSAALDEPSWFARIERWIRNVDYIQIREPDLTARELTHLTRAVCRLDRAARVLVNDRIDVALASSADGVHLRDGSGTGAFARPPIPRHLILSVAAHDIEGVRRAAEIGASYVLLAPVFTPLSKRSNTPPLGLDLLHEAARSVRLPILALGGITESNARQCLEAGAAGVAGISLFG